MLCCENLVEQKWEDDILVINHVCNGRDEPHIARISKEQIALRPSGYKGAFQAYVKCPGCDTGIVIMKEYIPEDVWLYLIDKWILK